MQQLDREGWTTANLTNYAKIFNVKDADLMEAKASEYDDPETSEDGDGE